MKTSLQSSLKQLYAAIQIQEGRKARVKLKVSLGGVFKFANVKFRKQGLPYYHSSQSSEITLQLSCQLGRQEHHQGGETRHLPLCVGCSSWSRCLLLLRRAVRGASGWWTLTHRALFGWTQGPRAMIELTLVCPSLVPSTTLQS